MHSEVSQPTASAGPMMVSTRAWRARIRGVLVAGPCWAIIAVALSLSPRAAGLGTHQDLGLPNCSFAARTGYPCPTCGMTTSIVAAAHGRLGAAWQAHPFGLVLFAAIVVLAAFGTGELITGRRLIQKLRPSLWWAAVGLGGVLVGWGLKVASGCASGTLPMH